MANSWQLQSAKARLSEVLRRAQEAGPQEITVHGEAKALVISKADYDKLAHGSQSLVAFLRRSPLKGLDLEIERDGSPARRVRL